MNNDTRTPTIGAIARIGDGQETGLVILGDVADEHETTALVLPLTRECRDQLYDRLVLAFSGRADRYELASTALAAIGVEVPAAARVAA